jgi:hypothetical protein
LLLLLLLLLLITMGVTGWSNGSRIRAIAVLQALRQWS